MVKIYTDEVRKYLNDMHARLDAAGVHFDDSVKCPLWSEFGNGCTLAKPYGVKVVVFVGYDTDIDTSWLDETKEEDADLLAHIEGYVVGVFLLNDNDELLEWDTCGTTIDGRDTRREIEAYLGEIALDLIDGMQDKINNAVNIAGERIARYV